MAYNALDKAIIAKKPILKKAIGGVVNKVKDVTSTAMSYMPGMGRMSAESAGRKANKLTTLVKESRAYDNAPSRNDDGSISDAGKTHYMKKALVSEHMKKMKKISSNQGSYGN